MNYEEDWIMRQVQILVDFAGKLLIKKDPNKKENQEEIDPSRTRELKGIELEINRLVDKGDINQAENLLYRKIDITSSSYLILGVNFYTRLNNMEDRDLETGGFSRWEVGLGIKDFLREYNLYYNK